MPDLSSIHSALLALALGLLFAFGWQAGAHLWSLITPPVARTTLAIAIVALALLLILHVI